MADPREEELVARARNGDRAALEELLSSVKGFIFNLAARMLGSPTDAEDAAQEILIRLVTNLDGFRGESAFRTWAYRVAANQLLKTRARTEETRLDSLEAVSEYLADGIAADRPPLDDQVLVHEAKLRCTSAMVLRLERPDRLAFILGEILDLAADEAAAVCEISPEAFRKRLSRARARMADFVQKTCGLYDPKNPCRCAKQAANAVEKGYLGRDKLQWAHQPKAAEPNPALVAEVDEITRAVAVLRGHPSYAAPEAMIEGLKRLLEPGRGNLI